MKIIGFFLLCSLLTSCAPFHSNKLSHIESQRQQWLSEAHNGNARAQYELGNAWCCDENGSYFMTKNAISWWCKAARQGHEKAQKSLHHHGAWSVCNIDEPSFSTQDDQT